jgi:hypothetical protein
MKYLLLVFLFIGCGKGEKILTDCYRQPFKVNIQGPMERLFIHYGKELTCEDDICFPVEQRTMELDVVNPIVDKLELTGPLYVYFSQVNGPFWSETKIDKIEVCNEIHN